MTDVSTIVTSQFPEVYQTDAPNLIAFVQAYYEWYEQSELIKSSQLLELRDIDTTVDEFVVYFKNKYLAGVPLSTEVDLRNFIKNSHSFYETKGTSKSVELLFKLLYNVEANVYYPGDDILRASDGKWYQPLYLEVTPSPHNMQLVGKEIIGARSGAHALVEGVVRRVTKGAYFDVLNLSNLNGDFAFGERIVDQTGVLENAPQVIGSLNELIIVNGGKNNNIGDLFDIHSVTGKKGRARVTGIENGTGRVDFELVDGGSGYSLTADTIVAERMMTVSNVRNANTEIHAFIPFETVVQPIANISFLSSNNTFATGDAIVGYTSGTQIFQANGIVVTTNQTGANGFIRVLTTAGDFRFADRIRTQSNTVGALVDVVVDVTATGNVVGSNSTMLGVHDVHNVFYTQGSNTFIRGVTSNTVANVESFGLGSGADFNVGSIENTETVFVNTDFFRELNIANTPFLNVYLDGHGSGVGFVDKIVIGEQYDISNSVGSLTANSFVYQTNANNETVARGLLYFANSTNVRLYPTINTFSTALSIQTSTGSANITNVAVLGGTGYANTDTISFVGGGQSITSVVVDSAGTGYANGEHLIVGGDGTGAAISIITNGLGGIVTTFIADGGRGYTSAPPLVANTTSGTGAVLTAVLGKLSNNAAASLTTDSNGALISVAVDLPGASYYSMPRVDFSGGSGANVYVQMDYGYGFVKNPNGDSENIINDLLTTESVTFGTISALSGIAPGSGYNINPFVAVAEPLISGMQHRDLIIDIASSNGSFIEGEFIKQDTIAPTKEIIFTGISGNTSFDVGELVRQANSVIGTVYYRDSSHVRLKDIITNPVVTSNTATKIIGDVSHATANVTTINNVSLLSSAKGKVVSANTTVLNIRRTSVGTSFNNTGTIQGIGSGASATILNITPNYLTPVMGLNAIVDAQVKTANGIATSVEIINSGFGYTNDELVTASNPDNEFVITGITKMNHQGRGEGFWTTTDGFLDADKYIHDGRYYQAFSYEIQTNMSLERYSNLVKQLLHVAGTELFGKTTIELNSSITIEGSSVIEQPTDFLIYHDVPLTYQGNLITYTVVPTLRDLTYTGVPLTYNSTTLSYTPRP